jgi:hypothetical protein
MITMVSGGTAPPMESPDDEQRILENIMITLDAFLVVLAAVSLPVSYLFVVSRWLEAEDRKTSPDAVAPKAALAPRRFVEKPA